MGYRLGVDLGTTWTAAAVMRSGGPGAVEVASLGNRAPVVPSLVAVRADGEVLVGEAAARRGATEPDRVAREFKRRIGDPTPILLGGAPWSADGLTGLLLRWVVDRVAEVEGGPPDAVAVAHPANWGEYKKDLLRQAITRADLDLRGVVLVPEPEAAAAHYAAQQRVAPGSVVAVYDLGGGTFDVAALRKTATGWEILGEPQGVERLGGIDFDEAVFGHVVATLGLDVDTATPVVLARLRADCVDAKENLSADTAVAIPVAVAGPHREVRLTRSEFEDMIRGPLSATTAAVRRVLRSAALTPEAVDAVLLVGGSSRIPLVGQLVGQELARPVAIDTHPKHAVALGAARVAPPLPAAPNRRPGGGAGPPVRGPVHPEPSRRVPPPPPPAASPPPAAAAAVAPSPAAAAVVAPAPAAPASPAAAPVAPRPAAPPSNRWPLRLAVAGTAAVAVVVALILQDGGGAGPGPAATTSSAPVTSAAPPPQVPRFDADFSGAPGEGDELIAWLDARVGLAVHLDLTFVDEPIMTDSPELWTDCVATMPPEAEPSTEYCSAYTLHIRTEDGDRSPFFVSRGRTQLEGYFLVAGTGSTHQGYTGIPLDPVSADAALDRTS
jgi:actin-like ATPase involved in cell morphogenesis